MNISKRYTLTTSLFVNIANGPMIPTMPGTSIPKPTSCCRTNVSIVTKGACSLISWKTMRKHTQDRTCFNVHGVAALANSLPKNPCTSTSRSTSTLTMELRGHVMPVRTNLFTTQSTTSDSIAGDNIALDFKHYVVNCSSGHLKNWHMKKEENVKSAMTL